MTLWRQLKETSDPRGTAAVLQRALDAGGIVEVPPGTWTITTLRLRSNTTLRLARGAVLRAHANLDDYPTGRAGHNKDRQPYHLLWAQECENLTIEGDGTIDGNGRAFWDEPVSVVQARGSHFVAFDGNGNVAALLNAQTAQTSAEYEYGPFGETIRATGPMERENPFRFSTKRTDDTTGLILYEYRAYQPSTGRWLSQDPLGDFAFVKASSRRQLFQDGILSSIRAVRNPYAFAENEPVGHLDALGLYTVKKCTVVLFYGHGDIDFFKKVKLEDKGKGCAGTSAVTCKSNKILAFLEGVIPGAVGTDLDTLFTGSKDDAELFGWAWWKDLMNANMAAAEKFANDTLCKKGKGNCCCQEVKIITKMIWHIPGEFPLYDGKTIKCKDSK